MTAAHVGSLVSHPEETTDPPHIQREQGKLICESECFSFQVDHKLLIYITISVLCKLFQQPEHIEGVLIVDPVHLMLQLLSGPLHETKPYHY